MSGELQTIPARHGVATFVPRGRTIKVINTYGKQVVSMWAFSLGPPPEDGDGDEEGEVNEDEVEREAEGLKRAVEEGEGSGEGAEEVGKDRGSANKEEKAEKEPVGEAAKETESTDKTKDDGDDASAKATDTPGDDKTSETTAKQSNKRTWASYLPSIPYRGKGKADKSAPEQKPSAEEEKAQNEANTRKWSSYLPTGKGISNYVPNVQVPDTKDVVSAFKSSHYRDPNKSYAEQLYDFSKTPVGAGTIAAATGSGYASSVYAAYSAYATLHPSTSSPPPMEYLSLPHTRAASHKLVPSVNDELLTNLRNPIVTLLEDTSPGDHDTLTAACDANLYRALGVTKPEEHGSCAENLVLALKELNETAGLKGARAVGADITVNIAPTPLHLFMNAPLRYPNGEGAETKDAGVGAKGVTLTVEEPQAKKRSFVRFRAERDVVVVFSACPMDVGKQNGGRCMAANFLVEEGEGEGEGEKRDLKGSVEGLRKDGGGPRKLGDKKVKKEEGVQKDKKKDEEEAKEKGENEKAKKNAPRKLSTQQAAPPSQSQPAANGAEEKDEAPPSKDPKDDTDQKPKKKPKKLQVRSGGTSAS